MSRHCSLLILMAVFLFTVSCAGVGAIPKDAVLDPLKPPKGMAFIKGGCFMMGDIEGIGHDYERPAHEVCVDGFYIDIYEVTQKFYKRVMRENPSKFKGAENPVDQVSWAQARGYCGKLGKRIPTEAEWEYAARGGAKGDTWAGTSDEKELVDYAWYNENAYKKTYPVGQKRPNAFGLYDMGGNVMEWVNDIFDKGYYKASPRKNPAGPVEGDPHVLRGGSWMFGAKYIRTANRDWSGVTKGQDDYGFRCAISR